MHPSPPLNTSGVLRQSRMKIDAAPGGSLTLAALKIKT
jgi:hypothetical protein